MRGAQFLGEGTRSSRATLFRFASRIFEMKTTRSKDLFHHDKRSLPDTMKGTNIA